jgi:hypothetical protein
MKGAATPGASWPPLLQSGVGWYSLAEHESAFLNMAEFTFTVFVGKMSD